MDIQKYASGPVGRLHAVCAHALILVVIPVPRPAVSWTGQICPILLTDISGFSRRSRSDDDRLNLRRIMYSLLQQAFEAAGLSWREFHTEDRGDGALIVSPPDIPAGAVATYVPGRLAAALRRHNQSASDALRMQLRVALHAGPVTGDAQGMTGNAINQTARLIQAGLLRKHLKETGADLGIIVSAYIYDNVIRQHGGQPIGPADYRRIRFRAKESALTAWIHLAGRREPPPVAAKAAARASPIPGTAPPACRRAGRPEARERPGIGSVEHDFPDPGDGRLAGFAHRR